MNTQAQLPDWTPRDFIEQAQIDVDQAIYDLTAATVNIAALYQCAETREHITANGGLIMSDCLRLLNILEHITQTELATKGPTRCQQL